jgi:hypothetical protein
MLLRKFNTQSEAHLWVSDHIVTLRKEYVANNRTAKEIALMFNVVHCQRFVKALNQALPKSHHGGPRPGAGNKKGWNNK